MREKTAISSMFFPPRHDFDRLKMSFLCLFSLTATIHSLPVLASTSIPTVCNSYDTYNASSLAMSEILDSPFPYNFPVLGQNSAELFPMPHCNGITLEEATIDQLQDAMEKGRLTSVQIAVCYLQRIWQTDEYVK